MIHYRYLYYYGYRYYDPSTGRWLSRDPLGELGGLNPYHFVFNDPISQMDYLGEWGNGNNGNTGQPGMTAATRGHSDFYGSSDLGNGHDFDFTAWDDSWFHGTKRLQLVPSTLIGFATFGHMGLGTHFRPLADTESDLLKAVKGCSHDDFQNYAHQMQDFFSHYGQGYRWYSVGHGLQSVVDNDIVNPVAGLFNGGKHILASPDNAKDFSGAWYLADERTKVWVQKWDKSCQKCGKKDGKDNWVEKPGRPTPDYSGLTGFKNNDLSPNLPKW